MTKRMFGASAMAKNHAGLHHHSSWMANLARCARRDMPWLAVQFWLLAVDVCHNTVCLANSLPFLQSCNICKDQAKWWMYQNLVLCSHFIVFAPPDLVQLSSMLHSASGISFHSYSRSLGHLLCCWWIWLAWGIGGFDLCVELLWELEVTVLYII